MLLLKKIYLIKWGFVNRFSLKYVFKLCLSDYLMLKTNELDLSRRKTLLLIQKSNNK